MAQNNSVIADVLAVIDEVGLNHSCVMGKAVILEGGLSDHVRALRVPAFSKTICDSEGMINGLIVQQNMLSARRALLAHVAGVLQEKKGAVLKSKKNSHGSTVDEVYHFIIKGQDVDLILMPG